MASASPRRAELMKLAGFKFLVAPSAADEGLPDGVEPEKWAVILAERKALDVAGRFPEAVVVGADTIVACEGRVLGKPRDKAEAAEMLGFLSGKRHQVFTGVCIVRGGLKRSFCCCTDVEFYPLSEDEIWDYVNSGEPLDKAGAYGIQGKGALLVKEICGDYYNVVGLPIAMLCRELKEMGVQG